MVVVNKVIHRFVRDRADYEEGGALYNQIIPYNVQAYSYKLKENGDPSNPDDYIIAYVLGTGSSTYMEIANGQGKDPEGERLPALSKEIFVTSKEELDILLDEKVTHLKELTSEEATLRKGEIVQYIGETTPDYTEGYFYKANINSGGYVINLDGSRLTGISNVTIDQEKLHDALESYGLNLPLDFQADHTHYWTCVSSMGGSSLCIGTEVLNDVWGITWEGTPEYATPDLFTIIDIEEEPGYGYWTRIDVQPSSSGGYLAMWNCATGLPLSDSLPNFYQYNEGDYFVVGNAVVPSDANATIEQIYGEGLSDLAVDITVLETKLSELIDTTLRFYYNNENEWVLNDEVVDIAEYGVTYEGIPEAGNRIDVVYTAAVYNYKPSGTVYERGVASRVVETESISVNNTYMFNGIEWVLQASGKVDDVQLNGVSIVENKIANIEPTASDVAYTNEQYPAMHTLQDAMNKLLYITPSVSISGGGTYEIGSTRATTTLTWSWNKAIVSQSLNQGIGSLDPLARTYTYDTPINSNITFTITGTDGTTTKSASTSVSFLPKRYWGVSIETSLTDADILALSQELSTSRTQTRTFDCSGGKYFYFVIRTSYCNGISFKVNGLAFTDMDVVTRNVINAQGFEAEYNIYRVHNIQTGSVIEVQVL